MASKTLDGRFKFEIVRKIAKISKRGTWNLELNEVKFGDADAKLDLRVWSEGHTLMGKGIAFSVEEFEVLKGIDGSNENKNKKKKGKYSKRIKESGLSSILIGTKKRK